METSSPVSQVVTMGTVYSHVSSAAKLYQAQGVKQKSLLLLTLSQGLADGGASDRYLHKMIYIYLAVRIKSFEGLGYFPGFLLAFPALLSCHMQMKVEKHQTE